MAAPSSTLKARALKLQVTSRSRAPPSSTYDVLGTHHSHGRSAPLKGRSTGLRGTHPERARRDVPLEASLGDFAEAGHLPLERELQLVDPLQLLRCSDAPDES